MTDDECHGRCQPHRTWFSRECRGLLSEEEAHEVLDMYFNEPAEEVTDRWFAYEVRGLLFHEEATAVLHVLRERVGAGSPDGPAGTR